MIIKIFSSFGTSEGAKEACERVFESSNINGYGQSFSITADDNYTHAIILNTAMPKLKIPPQNVIGLAFEPLQFLNISHQFVDYAIKHIGKYLIGDKHNLPLPFVEHYAYMWHITPLKYIPIKNKLGSIMISEKEFAPGHSYRHQLVRQILGSSLPFDIYGRGCQLYNNDSRLKGTFTDYEPYENYSFHICIENFETNHYFSEKITNTLLCGTTPIYLGCRNIDKYFPEHVIHLSGKINNDMRLLSDIAINPHHYKKNIDINFIKGKTNLLNNIYKLFLT